MSKNIRTPSNKAGVDEWARFWRRWSKIVRTKGGVTGMKY